MHARRAYTMGMAHDQRDVVAGERDKPINEQRF
jgi:hypothetical protein